MRTLANAHATTDNGIELVVRYLDNRVNQITVSLDHAEARRLYESLTVALALLPVGGD